MKFYNILASLLMFAFYGTCQAASLLTPDTLSSASQLIQGLLKSGQLRYATNGMNFG